MRIYESVDLELGGLFAIYIYIYPSARFAHFSSLRLLWCWWWLSFISEAKRNQPHRKRNYRSKSLACDAIFHWVPQKQYGRIFVMASFDFFQSLWSLEEALPNLNISYIVFIYPLLCICFPSDRSHPFNLFANKYSDADQSGQNYNNSFHQAHSLHQKKWPFSLSWSFHLVETSKCR